MVSEPNEPDFKRWTDEAKRLAYLVRQSDMNWPHIKRALEDAYARGLAAGAAAERERLLARLRDYNDAIAEVIAEEEPPLNVADLAKLSGTSSVIRGTPSHVGHGRGDVDNGPDDSDCLCRGTNEQADCATSGCGFCVVASTPSRAELDAVQAEAQQFVASLPDHLRSKDVASPAPECDECGGPPCWCSEKQPQPSPADPEEDAANALVDGLLSKARTKEWKPIEPALSDEQIAEMERRASNWWADANECRNDVEALVDEIRRLRKEQRR